MDSSIDLDEISIYDDNACYQQESEYKTECNVGCFPRRAVRDQRKAGPKGNTTDRSCNREAELKRPDTERQGDRKKRHATMKAETSTGPAQQVQFSDADSDGESVHTIRSIQLLRSIKSHTSNRSKHSNMRIRSGFLDKPQSNVLIKHRWPHMNQDPRCVTRTLGFNDLNFCQFVGGECSTIMRTQEPDEWQGRLRILLKVAYLYDICGNWERARSTYYAIVGSIEVGEAQWTSSFGYYDLMCPAPVIETKLIKQEQPRMSHVRAPNKREFFCRDFQKGDCMQQQPHKLWIRNNLETVEHFCADCYRAKNGKQFHQPGTEKCGSTK